MLWRVVGFTLLTIWWLPLGVVFSLLAINESTMAKVVACACAAIVTLVQLPFAWRQIKRHDGFLFVLKCLVVGLPIIPAALAYRSANTPETLSLAVWLQLAIAGGVFAFPSCIGALALVTPVVGAKAESQGLAVISAGLVGYVATAYCTVVTKIQIETQGPHIDSIDAVASALWFAPTAAMCLGIAMLAVVSREITDMNSHLSELPGLKPAN